MESAVERKVVTRNRVDLRLTLGPLRLGGGADPCMRFETDAAWRATRTARGPATLHLRSIGPCEVIATAWGPGAQLVMDGAPELIGANDPDALDVLADAHPLVTDLARRLPGLRIGRSAAVLEALVPTVLAQKVIGTEARAAFVAMVRAARQPAPGPAGALGLLLPPEPSWLVSTPSWAFHRWGVEHKRASTIKIAAGYAHRLEETVGLSLPEARRRIAALPGVGPWTVNEVAMMALGDRDAVSVGDYWLPHLVSWALLGESRGSDERMLELIEPWRGERGRVMRLLGAGASHPPRFGPRLALRDIARH